MSRRLVLLAAVVVALGGLASAGAADRGAPTADAAYVDTAATGRVTDTLRVALTALGSFDYQDPARTDRAAAEDLTGTARAQFAAATAATRAAATRDHLVRTAAVRTLGLRDLTADRTGAVAVLDQQTLREGTVTASRTSTVWLTATRSGGDWVVDSLTVY